MRCKINPGEYSPLKLSEIFSATAKLFRYGFFSFNLSISLAKIVQSTK